MAGLSSLPLGTPSGAAPGDRTAPGAGNIDGLRLAVANDPKGSVKEVARQFEGLFMQELMKSMRQSVDSDGMLDNAGSKLGTEMLDTQLANLMTGLPQGLGSAIARQLEQQMGLPVEPRPLGVLPPATSTVTNPGVTGTSAPADPPHRAPTTRQGEFVRRHTEAAQAAEAQTGIPAAFMVAQAAHESGWGRREIRTADGGSSFNLFGIKAGPNWKGKVATVTTTEFRDGVAHKTTAKFRAYGSYEESFRDYAQLMTKSPRYANVVSKAAGAATTMASASTFATGLQRAGYATDPAYADKLTRVINTTLRLQRSVA